MGTAVGTAVGTVVGTAVETVTAMETVAVTAQATAEGLGIQQMAAMATEGAQRMRKEKRIMAPRLVHSGA